jgi:hypothetical protein
MSEEATVLQNAAQWRAAWVPHNVPPVARPPGSA